MIFLIVIMVFLIVNSKVVEVCSQTFVTVNIKVIELYGQIFHKLD